MIRFLATTFAGLLGLAFGSFLNVCVSRWPAGESVVSPRSHCRECGRTLAWWENVPLLSWLALRGKCRTCGARISVRYVVVEAVVGVLWAATVWRVSGSEFNMDVPSTDVRMAIASGVLDMAFIWALVALTVLDAEYLWLPDWITWPGILVGFAWTNLQGYLDERAIHIGIGAFGAAITTALEIAAAAGIILVIRFAYWIVRRREGIGLGDAKLMAMLGAWLGLSGALLSFGIGVGIGGIAAVATLVRSRQDDSGWGASKLPLGTFLCIGGIVSSFWGPKIISAYLRWAGF